MKRWHNKLRSERKPVLEFDAGPAGRLPEAEPARACASDYIRALYQAKPDYRAICSILPSGAVFCCDNHLVSCPLKEIDPLPQLPPGYGYKGGAARLLLGRAAFPGRSSRQARDLDVVRLGAQWNDMDTNISREIMPRDFTRGQGVELVSDTRRYFDSRDLSINEVIWLDGILQCTLLCLLDTAGCVLRPSFYRGGSIHRPPSMSGRTFLKMLRLGAEAAAAGESWIAAGIPDDIEATDFDLAVELNKVFQTGENAAQAFLKNCARAGMFSEDELKLSFSELVAQLCSAAYGGLDFFDCMPAELKKSVAGMLESPSDLSPGDPTPGGAAGA